MTDPKLTSAVPTGSGFERLALRGITADLALRLQRYFGMRADFRHCDHQIVMGG